MPDPKLDLLQGTLDLMVPQMLDLIGPLYGYGIARRMGQLSENEILLNHGTIYASLIRLQQRGRISPEWGVSENNRRAEFYAIAFYVTANKAGKREMKEDCSQWERVSSVMRRVLIATAGDKP